MTCAKFTNRKLTQYFLLWNSDNYTETLKELYLKILHSNYSDTIQRGDDQYLLDEDVASFPSDIPLNTKQQELVYITNNNPSVIMFIPQ